MASITARKGIKTLKTGVIGVGYLSLFHAQKYQMLADSQPVGVHDITCAQRGRWRASIPITLTP
ncbi:MAG: hypothetical protein U1F68_01210 [Gammaproteobacteria bacterium]